MWCGVGASSGQIGSASVLTAGNVWVFGYAASGAAKLGVWHFNGRAWTQLPKTFTNGAGVSGTAAWAASGTNLEHYNGSKWTAASIANVGFTRELAGGDAISPADKLIVKLYYLS